MRVYTLSSSKKWRISKISNSETLLKTCSTVQPRNYLTWTTIYISCRGVFPSKAFRYDPYDELSRESINNPTTRAFSRINFIYVLGGRRKEKRKTKKKKKETNSRIPWPPWATEIDSSLNQWAVVGVEAGPRKNSRSRCVGGAG